MSDIDRTSFENGKYTIQLNHKTGDLKLFRYDELWDEGPIQYSKMLITILYETLDLRDKNKDLQISLSALLSAQEEV